MNSTEKNGPGAGMLQESLSLTLLPGLEEQSQRCICT